jgi:hypothetical protein
MLSRRSIDLLVLPEESYRIPLTVVVELSQEQHRDIIISYKGLLPGKAPGRPSMDYLFLS